MSGTEGTRYFIWTASLRRTVIMTESRYIRTRRQPIRDCPKGIDFVVENMHKKCPECSLSARKRFEFSRKFGGGGTSSWDLDYLRIQSSVSVNEKPQTVKKKRCRLLKNDLNLSDRMTGMCQNESGAVRRGPELTRTRKSWSETLGLRRILVRIFL
jgi:hypothetical protein